MEYENLNCGLLAYLGDSVYEVNIRNYLVLNKKGHSSELQKESLKYVSAKSQSVILDTLIENNYLSEEELNLVMRSRNYKTNSKPKYVDIITYKKATALECLFGALYLNKNQIRIDELIKRIVGDM